MAREIHDHFFREAQREGYRSRAAYKLIEIDDRKRVLKPGDRVLDAGAAPGSWMQVASQRIGSKGHVVGVDLKPIEMLNNCDAAITIVQADLRTVDRHDLITPIAPALQFDVILSDMAPGTTGDPRSDHFRSADLCELLLGRASELLRRGGNFVMKIFEGERFPELLAQMREMFDAARAFKPKASRSESVEMYLIGKGYRPQVSDAQEDQSTRPTAGPRPRLKAGW
ncbi:MAG: RlmE family RNA methyltransferase [Phycisphaerales bacterium]